MRLYVFAFVLLAACYGYSQAVAEGALLNSSSSGATTKGATALGAALNGSFSNASSQVSNHSPHMVAPANRPKTPAKSTQRPATQTASSATPSQPAAANTQGIAFSVYPPSAAEQPAAPTKAVQPPAGNASTPPARYSDGAKPKR